MRVSTVPVSLQRPEPSLDTGLPSPASPRDDTRRLNPREHGAYAELTFPVLSGLILGGVTPAGLGLGLLVAALFLANEPLAVLLGARGDRLRDQLGPAARRRVGRLAALALTGGLTFAVTAGPAAWLALLAPVVLGALVVVAVARRKVKSVGGEVLVAGAFASMHAPLAASGGAASGGAASVGPAWGGVALLWLWAPAAVWFVGFALATLAVHSLKHRFKGRGPGGWTVPAARLLTGAVAAVSVAAPFALRAELLAGERLLALAVTPLALAALALSFAPVHPRHLKRVGWSLVAADLLTLVLLSVAAHTS